MEPIVRLDPTSGGLVNRHSTLKLFWHEISITETGDSEQQSELKAQSRVDTVKE